MNFIDFHCDNSFHFFARVLQGEDREINAYHSDNTLCKGAEFSLTELLEDDLPTMYVCPWCDASTLDTEHMRACSGYQTPATADEIKDAEFVE
jgi:hypothetical protein